MNRLLTLLALVTLATASALGQHSVALTCTDTTPNVTFDFYRGAVTGGPYTIINPSTLVMCSYTDTQVTGGGKYFYVATAWLNGSTSTYSNEVKAVVPQTPTSPTLNPPVVK